jgi:hypothetical protein
VQRSRIKNMCIMIESYIMRQLQLDDWTNTQKTFYPQKEKNHTHAM